ncbi:hypothetical protein P879_04375 [Paragonimus westermani]|uniref:Uncharacterized protein n=1 Tax=Paragonimus westermani TaxID=34504 RepID=A0A8T0DRQ4_9TREM|nr:hypothetical protein P879_04375 [Paragonimus westermani]
MRLKPINSDTAHREAVYFIMCCKTVGSVLLLMFIVVVTETEARNHTCYVCEACFDASMLSKNATRYGCNWCEKQILNGIVRRLCAEKDCPNIPKNFQGSYKYYCCQKDYCNGSDRVYPAIMIWSLFIGSGIALINF